MFIKALEHDHSLLNKIAEFTEDGKDSKEADTSIKEWVEDDKLIGLIKSGCFDDEKTKKRAEEYKRFSMRSVDVEKLMKVSPRVEESIEETSSVDESDKD